MTGDLSQRLGGRGTWPIEVELDLAGLGLNDVGVAQVLQRALDVGAAKGSLNVADSLALAAPLAVRADSHVGAGDAELFERHAILQFRQRRGHIAEPALAPDELAGVKFDRRDRPRISNALRRRRRRVRLSIRRLRILLNIEA